MENEKVSTLFADFQSTSKEEWKQKAIKDLKGADFERIIWKTLEGFNISPFYTKEDLNELEYLKNFENISEPPKSWINAEKIKYANPKQAHNAASEALHGGANGLIFDFGDHTDIDFSIILSEIDLSQIAVSFITRQNPIPLVKKFIEYIKTTSTNLADITGGLEFDPVGNYTISGSFSDTAYQELAEVIQLTETMPKFKSLTINGSHFKDSGASIVQEIAFTLNTLVEYIDNINKLGITEKDIINNTNLSFAVGTDYFMEMAKLKTVRILFHQIATAYGITENNPGDVRIHCFTSLWSKTIYDPSVNMLRDTTIAMSSIIGGCNSLTIEPYDANFKSPKSFLRRIARNISNIIRDESYLDKVVDPIAGSYFIQNLIDNQLQNAWAIFQQVESKEGLVAAFKSGEVQKMISEVSAEKLKKIASRRDVIVGTNQYPNIKESIDPQEIIPTDYPTVDGVELLKPQRGARDFEELRIDMENYVKEHGEDKRISVHLNEFGTNVAMRKARSNFSYNFFGTAGFKIVETSPSVTMEEIFQKIDSKNADVIVLCSSDDDYAEMGEAFAQQFKTKYPDKILVLAGYPKDVVEKLKSAGFDEFVHIKSNAITTLREMQKKLNVIN